MAYWAWFILGMILLIGEILLPGVYLLWWGLSSVLLAGVVWLLPNLTLIVQMVLYATLAVLLSIFVWRLQSKKRRIDHTLNLRGKRMIGQLGCVETVLPDGIGRGKFGDSTWRIKGDHLKPGQTVKVVNIQDITLIVTLVNPC